MGDADIIGFVTVSLIKKVGISSNIKAILQL